MIENIPWAGRIEKYNGFVSKKMNPSEQRAFEILKENKWQPQKIHGAIGLPDFICSQNRWVEVKLERNATITFTQFKMWDILIQNGEKIYLLIIGNIGKKYELLQICFAFDQLKDEKIMGKYIITSEEKIKGWSFRLETAKKRARIMAKKSGGNHHIFKYITTTKAKSGKLDKDGMPISLLVHSPIKISYE